MEAQMVRVGTFNWRILRTLSNYAFVVCLVIGFLEWYRREQFELVMNDPTAKAFWRQTGNVYERIQWISLGLFIGLRICYLTIEYIHDRRMIATTKGDG